MPVTQTKSYSFSSLLRIHRVAQKSLETSDGFLTTDYEVTFAILDFKLSLCFESKCMYSFGYFPGV